ncbi:MAG: hypothetical protein K2O67_01430, partial [Clostridia bacterium]|nr:hypothetical protein [Clostridia bacterium]
MFYSLANLEYLDISGLSIANDTGVTTMLYNLPKLKTLVISNSLAAQISNTGLFTFSPTWYNETGSQTYTASSPMTTGGTYYTEMPVCAHNNKTHSPAVAATCQSTGTVEYWHCNDCNNNIDATGTVLSTTTAPIDPNNHKYTNYVYNGNATCINDGTKTATCDYGCGKTDTQTATGSATGIHTFTNYVSNGDATCTADGTKTAQCNISGCTATETITDTGSKLAHNFTGAAWSNNPSEHWHVCTSTGCTATDTHVQHTFKWVVDTAATVTSTGVQHEECNVCGFAKSQGTVIPVLTCAHSNTTHSPAVAATCQSTGTVEYWHCNDCNKDIDASSTVLTNTTSAIDPNNHSFTNYIYNNDAACM